MTPECWYCGKPIRRNEAAESLPGGPVAVHARCVTPAEDALKKAA
jgi:hypothetical protein